MDEECKKTYHLLPLFSCLSEPVGPLIKIFSKNINDFVYSLATSVSATGTIVISGLGNNLIKIHELETGMLFQREKTPGICLDLLGEEYVKVCTCLAFIGGVQECCQFISIFLIGKANHPFTLTAN